MLNSPLITICLEGQLANNLDTSTTTLGYLYCNLAPTGYFYCDRAQPPGHITALLAAINLRYLGSQGSSCSRDHYMESKHMLVVASTVWHYNRNIQKSK